MKTYRPFKAVTQWHELAFVALFIAFAVLGVYFQSEQDIFIGYPVMVLISLLLMSLAAWLLSHINKRVDKKLNDRIYVCSIDPVTPGEVDRFIDVSRDNLQQIMKLYSTGDVQVVQKK